MMLSKIKNLFRKKNEPDELVQNSQGLSLEPESEAPKKVNNLLLGSIAAVVIGVLIFAVMSGGDDSTVKSNTNKDSGNVSTASLTSDKLNNLEKAKSTNSSDQKQMDSHEHANEEGVDDHDHFHEHGDVHATSNVNPNTVVATSQPQPIVLSDEEKEAKEDAKEARNEYKAQVKTRAKEDLDGSRSPIFFTLKQEKEDKKEATSASNTTVENANDYYNNYSKDNYISVVK